MKRLKELSIYEWALIGLVMAGAIFSYGESLWQKSFRNHELAQLEQHYEQLIQRTYILERLTHLNRNHTLATLGFGLTGLETYQDLYETSLEESKTILALNETVQVLGQVELEQFERLLAMEQRIHRGEQRNFEAYLEESHHYRNHLSYLTHELHLAGASHLANLKSFQNRLEQMELGSRVLYFTFWAFFFTVLVAVLLRLQTLRKSHIAQEKLMKVLIEQIPCGVVMVDMAGQVKMSNPYVKKVLRGPIEGDIGETFKYYRMYTSARCDELLPYERLPLARCFQEQKEIKDVVYLKINGELLVLACSVVPLKNHKAEMNGALLVFTDMTDEKILEMDKEFSFYNSKLETLGKVAATLAHEINTPLGCIRLASDILRQKNQVDTTGYRYLDLIDQSIDRMSGIIRSFKNFSRQADTESSFILCNLQDLLRESLELCQIDFEFKELPVELDLPACPIIAECSPSALGQVFINLFQNAYDSTNRQEERWIQVDLKTENHEVVIRVTDSGLGIDPYVVEKMFDPFFTTKSFGKGTGIGLGVSSRIMRAHSGSIRYEFFKGHTSFVLRFPLYQYGQAPLTANG